MLTPRRPAAVLLALIPVAAAGAPFDGTQGFDAYTGPVISSGRVVGLAGAYVGVAEGLAGAPSNPAAVAQRERHLARSWDWDGVVTWYLPNVGDISRQDLGNDGQTDGRLSGFSNAELGLSFQAGRLGVGVLARGWTVSAQRQGAGTVEMEIADGGLCVGWSALQDQLVLGASATAVSGTVRVQPPAAVASSVSYSGTTLRIGALFRPRGRPFRIGAAFDPGANATAVSDRAAVPVPTPSRFVFPWIASAGFSAWLGPNALRYNEPSPFALERHPEWGDGVAWVGSTVRPVLVSAQIDVVGRTPGAVTLESGLLQSQEAIESGRRASVAVRAGAEWESVPDAVRVRGGSYLEPSRAGAPYRPHATFGLEVRIPFWWRDLQIAVGGDVAERFRNLSLSLGFWSNLGPNRT